MKSPIIETRLFPSDIQTALHHTENLSEIIKLCSQWPEPNMTALHAGYTYWGQFIAHELGPREGVVPNRSSSLDLESLYGVTGWGDSETKVDDETGEFVLGDTLPVSGVPQVKKDLCRNSDGTPLIPDIRNDAHLLIGQFHVLMQRCHNSIVRQLICMGTNSDAKSNFLLAREILTFIFHRITINDYLEKISNKDVYEEIFLNQNKQYFALSPKLPLPVEFVDACFRFGHSQVKEDYTLNSYIDEVNLSKIFELSSAGSIVKQNQLPADHVVEWSKFFETARGQVPQGALRLCPNITIAMHDIPLLDEHSHNIIELNLLAGIKALLPSGQQVAEQLLEEFPSLEELGLKAFLDLGQSEKGKWVKEHLNQTKILDCTPLWLFILIEAEFSHAKGVKLGPLGSFLVCEILKNAINNKSIENIEDVESFMKESRMNDIVDMKDLINFVEANEKEL